MLVASDFLASNVLAPLRQAKKSLTTNDDKEELNDFVLRDVVWACRTAIASLEKINQAASNPTRRFTKSDSSDASSIYNESSWMNQGRISVTGTISTNTAYQHNSGLVVDRGTTRGQLRSVIESNLSDRFVHGSSRGTEQEDQVDAAAAADRWLRLRTFFQRNHEKADPAPPVVAPPSSNAPLRGIDELLEHVASSGDDITPLRAFAILCDDDDGDDDDGSEEKSNAKRGLVGSVSEGSSLSLFRLD